MQSSHSNTFTPINNQMDQTHETDEDLFDVNMDVDLLHDTSYDPAWEPDYYSYELSDSPPPSYEESTTGSSGNHPHSSSTLTATDPQTFHSHAPSQPQQPAPASSQPRSPPLPPVTTYSHALSLSPSQAVPTSSSSSSSSSDGGVALPTATVLAPICHHPVPLPPPGAPVPDRCPTCAATMHRAYVLNMKMEWDLARLDPDTPAAERSNARHAYFRARADEQNHLDGVEDDESSRGGSQAASALREAGRRRQRGARRAVFFEAGVPLASRGRPAGAFKRESRHYVPGKWVGEWEDTSGMRQSYAEYYDVMADYEEEVIVDDDEEDEEYCDDDYYDEDDDEKYCDEEGYYVDEE